MIGIYKITNIVNKKVYIGQSINVLQRWSQHKQHLKGGYHNNDHLQRSWNKYGADSFAFDLLERCTEEELNDKEVYYIKKYNSTDFKLGYNEKSGGGHEKMSEYVKEKLRKPRSKPRSPEHCRKLGLAHKGKKPWNFGKTTSLSARKKMSLKKLGVKAWNRKKVLCVETGEVFEGSRKAADKYNLISTNIRKCCRGERAKAGGLTWKYLD